MDRGQRQEEQFQDRLLIENRIDKFKLAFEVYERDFIWEGQYKLNFILEDTIHRINNFLSLLTRFPALGVELSDLVSQLTGLEY